MKLCTQAVTYALIYSSLTSRTMDCDSLPSLLSHHNHISFPRLFILPRQLNGIRLSAISVTQYPNVPDPHSPKGDDASLYAKYTEHRFQ